jgi:hypothetical protein
MDTDMAERPGSVSHEETIKISPTTGGTSIRIGNEGNAGGNDAMEGYDTKGGHSVHH